MVGGKQVGEAILDVPHSRFGTVEDVVAVDGKAICGTYKPGEPHSALQILSAYITSSDIILAQESIHEITNEIPVFQEVLTYMDMKGKTITPDVMRCQRETCRKIIAYEGNYLFVLKENQPSLLEDIRLYFEGQNIPDKWDSYKTVEKTRRALRNGFAVNSGIFPG